MIINKYIKNIVFSLAILLSFMAFANIALADTTYCAGGMTLTADEAAQAYADGVITVTFDKNSSSQVQVTMVNNTNCIFPATAQSYKVYDNVTFDTQTRIYDAGLVSIPAYSSHVFNIPLASCLTQVDAFYDDRGPDSKVLRGIIYGLDGRTFDSIPSAQGTFCSNVPNNPDSNLTASCHADDSSVRVGDTIRWTVNASGGNNSYSYTWTGSDGLYGNSSSVSRSYNYDGTKYAYVTVTSGNQVYNASCSAVVEDEENYDALDVSCYARPSSPEVGEKVTWYAEVDGGDGDYDYDWSGTEGLDGSRRTASIEYDYTGTKTAKVRVYSNGESETANCRVTVDGQNSVLAFSQSNQTPLESVYLSQVPYTGFGDNKASVWFTLGLALFSAYVAYVVIANKNKNKENA